MNKIKKQTHGPFMEYPGCMDNVALMKQVSINSLLSG